MKKLIIFGLLIYSSLSSGMIPKENCFIYIYSLTKKHEKKSEVKKYFFENEKKCQKTAEIYKENFNPDYIKSVEVNYRWNQK